MIKKYIRKLKSVDAIQFNGDNTQELAEFVNDSDVLRFRKVVNSREVLGLLDDLEDTLVIKKNDYLIKDLRGEFAVFGPEDFKDNFIENK